MDTVWETICRLSAQGATITAAEVNQRAAAGDEVVRVELDRLAQDGLIVREGEVIRLTDQGRNSCGSLKGIQPTADL